MATVADIMTHTLVTVSPETTIRDVARLLCNNRISGVPVVDANGKLVGIISESDLMVHAAAIGEIDDPHRGWWKSLFVNEAKLARNYARTHGQTAEQVMSTRVLTVTEIDTAADVARIMGQHRIKRLPVMRDGKLAGIVTRADLLKILAGSAPSRVGEPSDDAILEALQAKLDKLTWTRLSAKNVEVDHGVVRLTGSVRTEEERQALHVAAESVPGVVGVEDHLAPVVVPPVV
jgi:CBS domain-containing protein